MKKLEIIITLLVIVIVAILLGVRLFSTAKDKSFSKPIDPILKNLTEADKFYTLRQLNKSSATVNDRLKTVSGLTSDSSLSLTEKQKILNALVGANK